MDAPTAKLPDTFDATRTLTVPPAPLRRGLSFPCSSTVWPGALTRTESGREVFTVFGERQESSRIGSRTLQFRERKSQYFCNKLSAKGVNSKWSNFETETKLPSRYSFRKLSETAYCHLLSLIVTKNGIFIYTHDQMGSCYDRSD